MAGWRRSGLRDGLVDELVGLAVHYVVTARPVHEAVRARSGTT